MSLHFIHNIAGETGLIESLDGLGNIVASDRDLVIAAESVNVGLGSLRNGLVLLVE